jgi:hypothetical protein
MERGMSSGSIAFSFSTSSVFFFIVPSKVQRFKKRGAPVHRAPWRKATR